MTASSSESFASRVRSEVAHCALEPCCREPFLMALVAGAKYFSRYGKAVLRLSNVATVRTVVTMLKERGIAHSWRREVNADRRAQFYLIELPELPPSFYRLPPFERPCCRRAWMAGLFLVCGTVADPQRDYYFEWSPASWDCTNLLVGCLIDEDLQPTVGVRGKGQLVCLKRGEDVSVALSLVGATLARLEFEEVRALKETNNDLHRLVNAETANIKRTVEAAARQVALLRELKERGLWEELKRDSAELAELRLENPHASYRELGEMLDPPMTRAAVGKRLARLEKIVEEIVLGR